MEVRLTTEGASATPLDSPHLNSWRLDSSPEASTFVGSDSLAARTFVYTK